MTSKAICSVTSDYELHVKTASEVNYNLAEVIDMVMTVTDGHFHLDFFLLIHLFAVQCLSFVSPM